MDQLHLPPELYRELRDRSNADVSAWLGELAKLARWGKTQLGAGSEQNISTQQKTLHEISKSERP